MGKTGSARTPVPAVVVPRYRLISADTAPPTGMEQAIPITKRVRVKKNYSPG